MSRAYRHSASRPRRRGHLVTQTPHLAWWEVACSCGWATWFLTRRAVEAATSDHLGATS